MALIGLPASRPLCGFEAVLTKVAATVDIDFVTGDIGTPGDVGVPIGVDVAPVTVITTAAPTVPAVSVTTYGVAIGMADVVVIVPIIIVVRPFHDAPGQKPSHHCPGTEGKQGIGG